MEAVKDVRDLHSNMVRFIIFVFESVGYFLFLFTFQYG